MNARHQLSLFLLIVLCTMPLSAQPKRSMEIDDLFRVKRISDPQLSPDGRTVAFVMTEVSKAANRSNSDIWLIPAAGGEMRRLTNSPKHDRHPRWSPDGRSILFESNRGGSNQIYLIDVGGGEARQITSISTEAGQGVWSPAGTMIAFTSNVFPEFSDKPYTESNALNRKKLDDVESNPVKARLISRLPYRNWDSWIDGKRQHLFVMELDGGDPRNITPGDRDGVPISMTFSGGDEYEFSPDSREIAYTTVASDPREQAWRTDHDVMTFNLATGERKRVANNPAADGLPRYSPDGKYLAFRSQKQPGFEADRWQLMLYDRTTGSVRSLTESFDAGIDNFTWSSDSKRLFLEAELHANRPIWSVSTRGNDVTKIFDNAVNSDISTGEGSTLVFIHQSLNRPAELYTINQNGSTLRQLTRTNDQLFASLTLSDPESVWYAGAGGTRVQMWIVKPPSLSAGGDDPSKRYPLVFWVHGGPQGAFLNSWHYRWNAQLWAAQGYVLVLANPRGSTGFGQQFVNEITRDWGGKVYDDLMKGIAYLENLPYVDPSRMAAAGASYGGYMMNWFQGHTTKFKTLISHDGIYNYHSSYGTTEELWFDEWEHGLPWETPDFDKFSPHTYAGNFSTPMLIIHGELDYRVSFTEGMSLFTTLQRKGIPSKLLLFPDEGHWVLKPQNSEFWHKTVFSWLAEYLRP